MALSRRDTLRALAGAAATAPLAGCSLPGSGGPPADAATTSLDPERARELAERFAPTWYFDAEERWFPTDPRPYTSQADGETVVDGFDAFDGYSVRLAEAGEPPDPTLFYHGLRYEGSSLAVIQWWAYSAFDQFATNFHWHDWEVLHASVDLETEAPQLYVASAHSRKIPNNEFLAPGRPPTILLELGSHSSALSVNDEIDTFQRLPGVGTAADITNRALGALEQLTNLPAAYGLPRDEGFSLPYLVPELDGAPIYEHPDLPAVDRETLIGDSLTVRSFADLASPPDGLPRREPGLVFGPAARSDEVDVPYALVRSAELEDIAAFTGPQLSFEFAVPGFVDDLVASHITTSGVPWTQARYDDPAADISDPDHRQALADRYDAIDEPRGTNRVVALLGQAAETDEAPELEGLTVGEPSVEGIALLESEPEAVPTFRGAVVAQDLPEGDHRVTVNAAGNAPHSESVAVGGDADTVAGVEGSIPLVANEDAVKLGVDPDAAEADLRRLAVEDDFAGRLYDAPLDGPDAVYVHRGGAFTAEVEDADAELGAFRVNPADEARVEIERPETGKAVLSTFVADMIAESRGAVEERTTGRSNAVTGLVRAMEAVTEAARRAAERADAGNPGRADEALNRVAERLGGVADRLEAARGDLPAPLGNALERRLAQADRRTQQALEAGKL